MADNIVSPKGKFDVRTLCLWMGALIIGAILGLLGITWLDLSLAFVASVYTRLFQLLAVPTIALALITTLMMLSGSKDAGMIFRSTLKYTILTTLMAALVGLGLFVLVSPEALPMEKVAEGTTGEFTSLRTELSGESYMEHFLSVFPSNIVRPFLEGNVLSILLLSFAVGIALSRLPDSEPKKTVANFFIGMQDLLHMMIRGLIYTLPFGIVAFSGQLTSQIGAGMALDSLGRYVAVILGGNILQFFVVLPLFLFARGINPIAHLSSMMPAVLMALFTKSSAATLPMTMSSAENRAGVSPKVSRFVLPICTTINMNGCAAFILVTSLFVMKCGGMDLTFGTMLLWVLLSVVSAIGNAGVPMGCYFLTLSLMTGIGAPVAVMGIILPIYTIIDMVETAENVWSDSCVAKIVDCSIKS